jgi:deazaflavin-dependent oxidoreductase (nitroreductase family)
VAETFFYLTTRGRVTGQPRTIEIWFVTHEGCHYLVSENREASGWVKNLVRDPAVSFRIGNGPTANATARIVTDDATVAAVKKLMDAKYDWSDGLVVEIRPL